MVPVRTYLLCLKNTQYLDSGFLDELETAVRSAGDEPGVKVTSGQTTFVHSA